MVKGHEVDEFRRVFCIGGADIFNHHIRDILHFLTIIPELLEEMHILMGERCLHTVDHVVGIVAALAADIYGCKSGHGHIGCLRGSRINSHKTHHVLAGGVGLEFGLSANPIGAFLCNGTLSHFVAQLDFKFRAVQAGFSGKTGNIKLTLLLLRLFLHKGW